MALQTDNLAMIGLGVKNDQPPNLNQTKLLDGIHLRWGFRRELGFPWYGFYLFRRPAQAGRPLCLSSVIGGLKKDSALGNNYYTPIGLLSSDTNLVLTDDFAPSNQVEFALDERHHLRFELPAGELARRVELQVGFRPQNVGSRRERCLDFEKLITLPAQALNPNPLDLQGVTFEVKGGDSKPAGKTQFDLVNTTSGPLIGLNCGDGLTIKLPAPCNDVELLISQDRNTPANRIGFVRAFDSSNNEVDEVRMPFPNNEPEIIKLSGQGIRKIEVPSIIIIPPSWRNSAYLYRVCFDNLSFEDNAAVNITAFAGSTPVRTITISGQAGQVVPVTLEADAITAVEIAPSPTALVDLCYVPVAQGATQGWEQLPGFSYPMGLPVAQADYPCTTAAPASLLPQRVHYQLPPGWFQHSINQLHDQLRALVEGGPSATPMAERIFLAPPGVSDPPDPKPPKLSNFSVLDLILLGTLHPALAQLVGLYWVDQTAQENVFYDYLIVADHTGVGELDADNVLAVIQSSGFTQLDGYIIFNKTLAAEPPLPAPTGLRSYVLPGGTFPDAQGHLPTAWNNAGLRWELDLDSSGNLLPERAVLYLVWRADLGNGATPATVGNYDLVSKLPPGQTGEGMPKPILITEPRLPQGATPQRAPDWPPYPLHYIDRNLPDGWYSYQVSGIDLFGRHSKNSLPSVWYQWELATGTPAPWYYEFPAQETTVKLVGTPAIWLLDKIPPPLPTGVEASALDPADPWLTRDFEYSTWFDGLAEADRDKVIGLRVQWIWRLVHQRQAPDTVEFRIYFHPGTDLPASYEQAPNWQQRFHVVGYHEYFACINPTSREFNSSGGEDSINITAANGSSWSATTTTPWIKIKAGATGTGNGVVNYSIDPILVKPEDEDKPRIGTVQVAGHTFFVYQQNSEGKSPNKAGIAEGAKEDRAYQIFLPRIPATAPASLPLKPSLAEPVAYAHIGVSAADDKPHTKDHRTSGDFSNRIGNEGQVGPPAKIYVVLRKPPLTPALISEEERVYASPADYHDRSYYTYRWATPEQDDNLKLHLFRALDDALFKTDWLIRTTRFALDPNNAQHQRYFPTKWKADLNRQSVAAQALNAITSEADYDQLIQLADAVELLGRLPGNDGGGGLENVKQRDWPLRQAHQSLSATYLEDLTGWSAAKCEAVDDELNSFVLSGSAATPVGDEPTDKLSLDGNQDLTRIRPYRDTILLKSDKQSVSGQYRIIAVDAATRVLTLGDALKLDGDEPAWLIPLYQTLSDSSLRALALLPGNESAFVQVTINPLDAYEADPTDPSQKRWRDRRGPDNFADFVFDEIARRAFVDTLDGRATNRYLYRAAFVDGAHNQGELGLPGPVVYLPNVVPPRAPVITKILSGEREIILKWAFNREHDLAAYRVYRTENEDNTRDLRLMDLVATINQADINLSGSGVEWADNANLIGGHKYYYRLTAVDEVGNESEPTRVLMGIAVDTRVPPPPIWTEQTWLLHRKSADSFIDWPVDGIVPSDYAPVLRLGWRSETPEPQFVVTRLSSGEQVWTESADAILRPSTTDQHVFVFLDFDADPNNDLSYRLKVRSSSGVWSTEESILSVPPKGGE